MKARLPISVHATPDTKSETFICWQGKDEHSNPANSPRSCKPIIINVNTETKAGRKTTLTKSGDYCETPKTATVGRFLGSVLWGFHMLCRLTHLRWPRDFINWALLAFSSSYYTFSWRQALVLSMHRLIKRFISPFFPPSLVPARSWRGPPLTNSWHNGNVIMFEHCQAH